MPEQRQREMIKSQILVGAIKDGNIGVSTNAHYHIIIKIQIRLEFFFFFKLEHFSGNALRKILLQGSVICCALVTNPQTEIRYL